MRAPAGAKNVADLRKLARDGEEIVFEKTVEPSGEEPAFYRVSTRGEVQNHPRWVNSREINDCPRPPLMDWDPLPLSDIDVYRFELNDRRESMADLYGVTTGIYLISKTLAEVILSEDLESLELQSAVIHTRDQLGVSDFVVCMPMRVIDAVDIEKSDVLVVRREPVPGRGRFVTHVRYDNGYVLRRESVAGACSFLERYSGPDWLWSEGLVRAAKDAGLRGLRFVHTRKCAERPEIYI